MLRSFASRIWHWYVVREERGQTLVEYGLLLTFIALIVVVTVIVLGTSTSGFFRDFYDTWIDATEVQKRLDFDLP